MASEMTSDLSSLDNLTEENIRKALSERYEHDIIYTNIKDILIAINPRKPLRLYLDEIHEQYHYDQAVGGLEPHVFQVAAAAYKRMLQTDTDQVIIVSGESGAGKTESTKYMVKHLVHMCKGGDMELHNKLIEINPLLEAFGNAKTTLNENSSRFAKYLEVSFKEDGQLAGAVVRDYMLEKSRIVYQSEGEGIFHIFYAMFAGCTPTQRGDLFLPSDIDQYRILRSDPYHVDRTDSYKKMFSETMKILEKINVDSEVVLTMLAAVINISEIEFEEDDKGIAQIKDAAPFAHAARLLQLEEIAFGEALVASKRRLQNEAPVAVYKTVQQAEDGRDALAKILYERMFGWLVRMINQNLHPHRLGQGIKANIGILDIAGFEKLRTNSFEQLCINIVNEKLQNFMNKQIFTMEMELYAAEGVQLDDVKFENNDQLLRLFEEKKVGLLDILDEVSIFKQGSDQDFVLRVKQQFKDSKYFDCRGAERMFSIQHFATMVPYDTTGFLEKNRDRLNRELMEVMQFSEDPFLSDLFTVKRGPTGTISANAHTIRKSTRAKVMGVPAGHLVGRTALSKVQLKRTPEGKALAVDIGKSLMTKFGTVKPPDAKRHAPTPPDQTLVAFFKKSLLELLDKLQSGDPFFVRCIKANNAHRPNMFEDQVVSEQLKYNGLAEVAKIRKKGYPVRISYTDFVRRYRIVAPLRNLTKDSMFYAKTILEETPLRFRKKYRLGKTKVFMTSEVEDFLEVFINIRQRNAAKKVAKCVRKGVQILKQKRIAEEIRKAEEKRKNEEKRKRDEEERKRQEEERKWKEVNKHKREEINLESDSEESYDQPKSETESIPEDGYGNFHPDRLRDTKMLMRPGVSSSTSDSNRTSDSQSSHGRGPPTPPGPAAPDPPEDGPKQHFWDLPQIISRDRKVRDVDEDRGLQVIKAVAYILFFAILLWCAVAQKLSLMTLVAYQYNRTANATDSQAEERKIIAAGKHLLLAVAIMIPYCLTFLTSLFKWMFGSFPFPGFQAILFCIMMETIHSLGLCALVFIILPDMDIVRGIWLLNGVAVLPSILYPVTASEPRSNRKGCLRRIVLFSLSVLAAIVQVAFIPLVILFDNFVKESTIDSNAQTIVIFIIAMIFVSFSWWENFTDDRFCGRTNDNSFIKTTFLKLKFNLQESRPVISFFTSLWKIGITCLLTWLTKQYKPFSDSQNYGDHQIDNVSVADALRKLGDMPLKDNAAILTLTLTTFVGYYLAYTTCKLKIQKLSFSFPLIISTPVAVVIATLDCRPSFNLLIPFTSELRNECEQHDEVKEWVGVYIAGVMALASLYWLCRHIFSPNIERLARTERLFMNPFYCSVLFEQHLILNRRRHNRRVKKEIDPDKEFYSLSEYNFKVNIEGDEEEDKDSKQDSEEDETDIYADGYRNRKFRDIPMIYACATMWHETKVEMIQLMKSIFRMDRDQNIRKNAEILTGKEDKDFYEFEAHIFFDDCMDLDDDEELVPNSFVRELLSVLDESVSSVYAKSMKLMQPFIVPTPYGGQIVYRMPGENFLFIHLKDKTKIRHKKRWSQVMYMYYLLGYRIVRYCQETVTEALKHGRINELLGWEDGETVHGGQYGRSHIFHAFDEQTLRKASNTFVLALDGDVDFSPGAVKLLVDRMKKSEKVGAACGRIHPIGTGPVVWFQKFEYAIAHWLQKATEHVLGCVLCSPGCFSLFRGSALMDDNIMKKYTILPTEASNHLMYDQGEDRWLCTLLLQQGYRVDYAAGSDAFTYAPEGFAEFFNQRRRWMPSTVFNIIDLLADYQNTVFVNPNISMLYIFYQASLLLSTIIGPATVLMMIAGANLVVFKTNLIESYIIAMVPALFYFVVCFYVKPKLQIQFAQILTGLYAFVMMIVLVATIVTAAKESPFHPSVIFIAMLVIAFSFAALLHPKEWTNVIYGALYFILIPTGFLLLIFYSMANLHVVSWGTREVPKKKSKEEMESEKKALEEKKRKKKEQGFFGRFMPAFPTKELKDLISKITETKKEEPVSTSETVALLKDLNESMKTMIKIQIDAKNNVPLTNEQIDNALQKVTIRAQEESDPSPTKGILKDPLKPTQQLSVSISKQEPEIITEDGSVKPKRNDLVNPKWAEIPELQHGKKMPMVKEELNFWTAFIEKYLYPLDFSAEKKKNDQKALLELRTNICVGMAIVNLLWIAINFMFQYTKPTPININFTSSSSSEDNIENELTSETESSSSGPIKNLEVDALGLLFVFFYLLILLIQFAGMIMHRWGTFLHLVSVTKLKNPLKRQRARDLNTPKGLSAKEARKACERLLEEPLPDYPEDEELEQEQEREDQENAKRQLELLQKTGNRLRVTVNNKGIGASTRLLGQSQSDPSLLAKSARMLARMPSTHHLRPTVTMKSLDVTRREAQHILHRQHDQYRNRPLPPIIKRRRRLNTGPGRSTMISRWDSMLQHRYPDQERDLINPGPEDTPVDELCRQISKQGTVGRELGKRLQLYSKTTPITGKSVHFSNSTEMNHSSHQNSQNLTRFQRLQISRPNSMEMF
ncbi:hypothetical protein DPMN_078147 [Dreissena polymorpha]|uniref:chitin synthase n=1 Tax=Dreissena polymorpha TaxID=45954 RepID=A0A9D3YQ13_DREPO|nr:hypothetical protein DPMN_078147 [Dreissena polymorpha]